MISVKNKEPQIYYGSKPIKEVYKGSTKIYPSVDVQSIMDSMILWYDIKKQGATNESMATTPTLIDHSGNGHDATCYNFAWSLMSGIGGYNIDSTDWAVYSNAEYTIQNPTTIHITKVSPVNNDLLIAFISEYGSISQPIGTEFALPAIRFRVTGIQENELRAYTKGCNNNGYSQVLSDGIEYYFEGGEFISTNPANLGFEIGWTQNDKTEREVDITVELLPLYPNALVGDGVDDYAQVTGLPILTKERGYTVVAKRKWLQTIDEGALVTKSEVRDDGIGAFIIERNLPAEGINYAYSYGIANAINEFQTETTIIVQTSSSYNSTQIAKGNGTDTEVMSLFKFANGDNNVCDIAIYSFLLFDRDLTKQEIEWVKTNLIESNDDVLYKKQQTL